MIATTKATAKASTKTKAAATAELPLVVATEAVPQETDATTTAPDGAIIPAGETTAISRWEALALRIAEAEEKASSKRFDYRDKWENKAARSWVNELRGIKGSIERCRKEAKAVHLERGKAVDDSAKLLESAVQGLIEPHETAIKAIEAEEQARIDAHRAVLDRIAALADAAPAEGEAGIIDVDARLAELAAIDTSALQEFAQAGLNRQAEAIEQLGLLRDKLEAQESQRIELEALRAQAAAREDADRIARLQQEAVEADRLAREAEAAARVAEAEERARKEREDAATREAQALAQVEAARIAQEEAERRAEEAAAREEARVKQQAEMEAALREAAARAAAAQQQCRDAFVAALTATFTTMGPADAARAIADGTLHPAVKVDWSLVA
jgi:DNA repair exonuclease SbcCD ATPase subunit